MNPVDVLSTMRFTPELLEQLRVVSPRLHITQETCRNADQVAAALSAHPETRVLYTFFVPNDILQQAPSLRWIQLHTAGADHLQNQPVMESNMAITTVSGIHATPIAEYVMASMLAHRWRVAHWTECQREAQWPSGRWQLYARPELRASTLGILGYGSIGREVARLAKAFGMRVLALSRSGSRIDHGYTAGDIGDPEGAIPETIYKPEGLQEMLAECDYVVIALPLTPATTHLIGEAELHAMKPDAYLVNIARGGIIDEPALIRALEEGWIAGAGLDVFEEEPLPPESPLWNLDSALLSPHVAGFTPRYDERAVALFAQNLERYLNDERLLNLIDKERGY
ncbi:MAG: D-2-hydroxyacid dehydrogenase [Anaerolineae bacterium]|jgi:phosphoglycerate dehydrogenase-like enzyme